MNTLVKAVTLAALVVVGVAFAAPSFVFVKDPKMNGMMMNKNNKEVIELAAVPGYGLTARNVASSNAVFVYAVKDVAKDEKAIFAFYEKALVKEGWKSAGMMGGAMGAMDKPEGAMDKPEAAMGAMDKDGMGMAKKLVEKFSFKTYTITLEVFHKSSTRVEADLKIR